jgi:serine/threonine protein kinase
LKKILNNKEIDDVTIDLLDKMLDLNPEKRLSVLGCLKHEYFDDIFEEDELLSCSNFNFDYENELNKKSKKSK